MTIRISRLLPLFNFERLDELCNRIGHPCEKLGPFEFDESFRCSISSIWMSYVTELDIRVKSYDHSTLSRASIVQFRASRCIMTIRIWRELPLFNFEHLDELCHRIGHPCEKLWPFDFVESFHCSISSVSMYYVPESVFSVKRYDHSNLSRASVVQFRASRYIMSPNRSSVWKDMTIRICRELPLFNFERLDKLCPRIGHPSEILWPFESRELPLFNFEPLDELCFRIGHPVKSYDHLNFSSAFVVQFQASRYFMSSNQTSEWNVMTIRIFRELPFFNFERLNELCHWIRHPSEMLWPFEFVESFRCSISSV